MIHITKIQIQRDLFAKGFSFSKLLGTPEINPKVKKNLKEGLATFPLQLSPASLSGFNVCASSTEMCRSMCLHFAGNPMYFSAKEKARNNRTQAYFKARKLFLALLRKEIDTAIAWCNRKDLLCGFRLNTTSDIRWEVVYFEDGISVIDYILSKGALPYDYTKHPNRRKAPKGYHLTLSWSGDNEDKCVDGFSNGLNIAIPFTTSKHKELPKYFKLGQKNVPVFDGDISDNRPSDPEGHIIGLRWKFDTSPKALPRKEQLAEAVSSGFCIDALNDNRL